MRDGLRELQLLSASVSSPNMDGMPRTQSAPDKYAQVMIRIDSRKREIAAQEREIARAQVVARRVLEGVTGAFKAFCMDYYVDGLPFSLAVCASGVGDRQCKNYMAYIKKRASL